MNQTLTLWVLGIAFAIIGALANRILKAIDSQADTLGAQGTMLARMDTALRGVNGDNGLVGDVKALRQRVHDHGDELHALKGRVALNEHEIEELKGAA